MIYFYDDLVAKTVETIKEAYDCADILNDLNRINQAITNIKLYGNWSPADHLDQELRQKYPCINNMVEFANSIPVPVPRAKKIVLQAKHYSHIWSRTILGFFVILLSKSRWFIVSKNL